MRMTVFVFVLLLLVPGAAVAQEWEEYVNKQDGFKVNFPSPPKVTETTWKSEMDYTLPARVYSADKDRERYSVTVVTSLNWEWQDMVEGHFIQLTNNADQSRTFAYVAMHENKLYIVEGTVPKGYPEPGLFQQSMGWVDKDGNGIRYQMIYSNSYHGMGVYPVPPRAGRGGAAGPPRGDR